MKFKKVIPKEKWPDEKTIQRIEVVDIDIANFNRQMNKIDSQINELKEKKKSIMAKVSDKNKYRKQLVGQLTGKTKTII